MKSISRGIYDSSLWDLVALLGKERQGFLLYHTEHKGTLGLQCNAPGKISDFLRPVLPSTQGQGSLCSTARHLPGFTKGKIVSTYTVRTKQIMGAISVVLEHSFQAISAVFVFSDVCERLTDRYYGAD